MGGFVFILTLFGHFIRLVLWLYLLKSLENLDFSPKINKLKLFALNFNRRYFRLGANINYLRVPVFGWRKISAVPGLVKN